MRPVNIASMVQAKESLSKETFEEFLKHFGIKIKKGEMDDIRGLMELLTAAGVKVSALSDFFVGYKIPQIGKEFDLLRFGANAILNIEIKSESDPNKILEQLVRNKYYLSSTGRKVINFTFLSEENRIFFLNDQCCLEEVKLEFLCNVLAETKAQEVDKPDTLFNPSDYLVSPFNSTEKFLASTYFLTHQQEEIKNRLVAKVTSNAGPAFYSLSGGPGTGKTLLVYDIAKWAIESGQSVLIIHCGILNGGHEHLKTVGFNIVPIKNLPKVKLSDFNLVIVDETQRIFSEQLDKIIDDVRKNGSFCLLSHDGRQTLATGETKRDVASKILSIPGIEKHSLSDKIRSNAEIANFIKMLLKRSRNIGLLGGNNIEINYFKDIKSADSYLDSLANGPWELLRFTPSQYNKEYHEKYFKLRGQTSHQVIGQEFDGVAVVIDRWFSYDKNEDLIYSGDVYYDPVKMLFQNITRAKRRINLVIVNNEALLKRCTEILGG